MKNKVYFLLIITLALLFLCYSEAGANSAKWISYIQSGKPFLVVFNLTHDKFDDSIFNGNWRTDPMGALKGGQTYEVYYKNNSFTCRGFNQSTKNIGSWTYSNANPADNIISLWGFLFVFDGNGRLYSPKFGLVGSLKVIDKAPQVSANNKSKPSTPDTNTNNQLHIIPGKWSSSWGDVQMRLNGDLLVFDYLAKEHGKMIAKLVGPGTYRGRWAEDKSDKRCSTTWDQRHHWGNVTLKFTSATSFEADWGYCDGAQNQSKWRGHKAK